MSSSIEKISALLTLMNENGIVELELEEPEFSVALRKPGAFAHQAAVPMQPVLAPAPAPAAPAAAPAPVKGGGTDDPNLIQIKSPIVGTFYRSPSPETAPFVEEGAKVSKSTVVCIIEAMKIMNEIKAELEGKIERVLVESGEPVEYGQPLFLVRRG